MESNIWKEKKIAPLEYCSFDRAAKLLNCEYEDLIHWNKIGAISIAFEPTSLEGVLAVRFDETYNDDTNKYNDAFDITSELGFLGSRFHPRRGYKIGLYFEPLKSGFDYSGLIYGLWIVTSGVIDENHNILITNKSSKGYETFQPVNKADNIRSAFFFYKGSEELILELKHLFITRIDIEKIWDSVISGNPMESYFTGKTREDKPIQINSLSLAQTTRHEKNRQRVEDVAKKVRANHREECSKGGKIIMKRWMEATLKYRDTYGGFILSGKRGITNILKEITDEEDTLNTAL